MSTTKLPSFWSKWYALHQDSSHTGTILFTSYLSSLTDHNVIFHNQQGLTYIFNPAFHYDVLEKGHTHFLYGEYFTKLNKEEFDQSMESIGLQFLNVDCSWAYHSEEVKKYQVILFDNEV